MTDVPGASSCPRREQGRTPGPPLTTSYPIDYQLVLVSTCLNVRVAGLYAQINGVVHASLAFDQLLTSYPGGCWLA